MAHKHSVYDTDTHFKIDALTRSVKNVSETKTMLVQYDHNSERFTFEIPRYVDGHDLSLCNVVRVHYINIEKSKRTENKGVYEVTDLQVSPDDDEVVICSWIISNNATQFVGSLNFVVQFACVEDGDVLYSWNTARHTSVLVVDGIYNGDDIDEQYADILQSWYQKIFEMEGGNIDLNTGEAVKIWVGSSEEYKEEVDSIPDNCIVFLNDENILEDLDLGIAIGQDCEVTPSSTTNLPQADIHGGGVYAVTIDCDNIAIFPRTVTVSAFVETKYEISIAFEDDAVKLLVQFGMYEDKNAGHITASSKDGNAWYITSCKQIARW